LLIDRSIKRSTHPRYAALAAGGSLAQTAAVPNRDHYRFK
jgi:hypothetical protein